MNYVKEKKINAFIARLLSDSAARGRRRTQVPKYIQTSRIGNKDITRGPGISIKSLFLSMTLRLYSRTVLRGLRILVGGGGKRIDEKVYFIRCGDKIPKAFIVIRGFERISVLFRTGRTTTRRAEGESANNKMMKLRF